MRATDVMTNEVVTVRPQDPVREAARLLAGHGFTALPVVDGEGRLVGLVTEADVLRHRIPADPRNLLLGRDGNPSPCPSTVGEIMSSPTDAAVPAGADVSEVARLMLREHLRSVAVVDGSRLVGILTARDLVRCLGRSDETIAAEVRHRLATYAGLDRWRVGVHQGRVTIEDDRSDPVDAHVAKVIALAVPGVEFVEVVNVVPAQPGSAGDSPTVAMAGPDSGSDV